MQSLNKRRNNEATEREEDTKRVKTTHINDETAKKEEFSFKLVPSFGTLMKPNPEGMDSTGDDIPYENESGSSEEDEDEEEYEDLETMVERMKEEDPEAHANFLKVQEYLEETEPTAMKILKEPLKIEDKTRLVQLYEVYVATPSLSEEKIAYREQLISDFKQAKLSYKEYATYTPEEHKAIDQEEERLSNVRLAPAYKYRIINLQTTDENKAMIMRKYNELQEMSDDQEEYGKLKTWVDWAVSMPYDRMKTIPYDNLTTFLQNVRVELDRELYGMTKAKEQILVYLHSKILNPELKGGLALVGEPGTGKTAISRLLAKVLDYPFEQISFGGMNNPDFLKGHDYTYVGAEPGIIAKSLRRMQYKNGILFLDEFEKISDNKDICASLLHITDAEQNMDFRDKYLSELPMDLSKLWFIYSMNSPPGDSALRDRLHIIQIEGYNHDDKVQIVENYTLPKALKNINRNPGDVIIPQDTISYLIGKVCSKFDKGVRTLNKTIFDLCNKLDFLITHQDENGNLPGFKVSFDVKQKLSYPLKLTPHLINTLVESKDLDRMIQMMYM